MCLSLANFRLSELVFPQMLSGISHKVYSWRHRRVRLHFDRARWVERDLCMSWRKWYTHSCTRLQETEKKGDKDSTSWSSTIEQDQALNSLSWDSLITTEPLASVTNNQPTPPTVEQKSYNFNVCPFHECNLILFVARTNGESCIKCKVDQCPIFMHQDWAYYYMSSVNGKLLENYLKRKRNLICGCEEVVHSKWGKQ